MKIKPEDLSVVINLILLFSPIVLLLFGKTDISQVLALMFIGHSIIMNK